MPRLVLMYTFKEEKILLCVVPILHFLVLFSFGVHQCHSLARGCITQMMVMSNVIKGLTCPHGTLIGFQMRWSKLDLRIGIRVKDHGFKSREYPVG